MLTTFGGLIFMIIIISFIRKIATEVRCIGMSLSLGKYSMFCPSNFKGIIQVFIIIIFFTPIKVGESTVVSLAEFPGESTVTSLAEFPGESTVVSLASRVEFRNP
jgi:hypothetical protein